MVAIILMCGGRIKFISYVQHVHIKVFVVKLYNNNVPCTILNLFKCTT